MIFQQSPSPGSEPCGADRPGDADGGFPFRDEPPPIPDVMLKVYLQDAKS